MKRNLDVTEFKWTFAQIGLLQCSMSCALDWFKFEKSVMSRELNWVKFLGVLLNCELNSFRYFRKVLIHDLTRTQEAGGRGGSYPSNFGSCPSIFNISPMALHGKKLAENRSGPQLDHSSCDHVIWFDSFLLEIWVDSIRFDESRTQAR